MFHFLEELTTINKLEEIILLNLTLKGFEKLNLGISYMNGLRNPTLYEMFGTDNFGYSGNKNLNLKKVILMRFIQM